MEAGREELHPHPGLAEDPAQMRQRILRRRLLGWMVPGGTLSLLAACDGSNGTKSAAATTTGSASGSTTATTNSGACAEFSVKTSGLSPADGFNSASATVVNVLK